MKRTRSFRFRLFASYVLLTAIPLLVLGTLFYRTSLKVVTDQAQDNVYEIVRKNNQLMDTKLRILDQNSMALFTDKDLFELFNDLDPSSGSELLAADRQVSDVLRNYFSQIDDVYAYQLWTSYFTFGQQLPQGDPTRSEVYRTAEQAGGKLVWYPTYDFAAMFGQPDYAEDNIDFRYLFSATRVLDFSYLSSSILRRLDESVERPVLVISLKYEALNKLFAGSLPDRSRYLVLDAGNRVAASDDTSLVSRAYGEPWIEDLQRLGSGRKRMTLGGEPVGEAPKNGYLELRRIWRPGDQVHLELDMPTEVVRSKPEVEANRGRIALRRGPIVYALEGADNPALSYDDFSLLANGAVRVHHDSQMLGGVTVLEAASPRSDEAPYRFVPYYAWDNREAGWMQVWIREQPDAQLYEF